MKTLSSWLIKLLALSNLEDKYNKHTNTAFPCPFLAKSEDLVYLFYLCPS